MENAERLALETEQEWPGFVPLTQDMIEEAFWRKAQIETLTRVYNVRRRGGELCLMKPRSRTYVCAVRGQLARFVLPRGPNDGLTVCQGKRLAKYLREREAKRLKS